MHEAAIVVEPAERDKVLGVWLGRSAIPKIPAHARVTASALRAGFLALQDPQGVVSPQRLAQHSARMQAEQPGLARWVVSKLAGRIDDAARGLGASLMLAVWLAFDRHAGARLRVLTESELERAENLLAADEELRRNDPSVVPESDDIVAVQQPDAAAFVRAKVDETLREYAAVVDVDDVDAVYRMILAELLALSYAVIEPGGERNANSCQPS